jgi:hypothetical protein
MNFEQGNLPIFVVTNAGRLGQAREHTGSGGHTDVFRDERIITRFNCMSVSHDEHISTICGMNLAEFTTRMTALPPHTFDCELLGGANVTNDNRILPSWYSINVSAITSP